MHDLAYTSMTLAFMTIVLAFTASVTLFAGSLLLAIVKDIHESVKVRKHADDTRGVGGDGLCASHDTGDDHHTVSDDDLHYQADIAGTTQEDTLCAGD